MERFPPPTASGSRHSMNTRSRGPANGSNTSSASTSSSSSSTTTQTPPPRLALVDPAPPPGQPTAARKPRTGASPSTGPSQLPQPVEREEPSASSSSRDDKKSVPVEPEFTRESAQNLLASKGLPLVLRSSEHANACNAVYELCHANKLPPQAVQLLMRTLIEDHCPSARADATSKLNLMSCIVPIFMGQEQQVGQWAPRIANMLAGCAPAFALPGQPGLSDGWLHMAATALVSTPPPRDLKGESSHEMGPQAHAWVIDAFSKAVLAELPPRSTTAFLRGMNHLKWVLETLCHNDVPHFHRLVAAVVCGLTAPGRPMKLHHHFEAVAGYVLGLDLSLSDRALLMGNATLGWTRHTTTPGNDVSMRLGALARMSLRNSLSPQQAGEVVLAALVRGAIARSPEGDQLIGKPPALKKLQKFDSLKNLGRKDLLVPDLPDAQQARLVRLSLMASGGKAGVEGFRDNLHQLVVDQALGGADSHALTLLSFAFVHGGGAKTSASLERAADVSPERAGRPLSEALAGLRLEGDSKKARPPHGVQASSSSSSSSPSSLSTEPTPKDAVRLGGELARAPLLALAQRSLSWADRQRLLDDVLSISAPVSAEDARALLQQIRKVEASDGEKAAALKLLVTHAERSFAAEGQKALIALMVAALERPGSIQRPAKVEEHDDDDARMQDDAPPADSKASRPQPGQLKAGVEDAAPDVLKLADAAFSQDAMLAWDAVAKDRVYTLPHDRRALIEHLDGTLGRLRAAESAMGKSTSHPRAKTTLGNLQGWIETLSKARDEAERAAT